MLALLGEKVGQLKKYIKGAGRVSSGGGVCTGKFLLVPEMSLNFLAQTESGVCSLCPRISVPETPK